MSAAQYRSKQLSAKTWPVSMFHKEAFKAVAVHGTPSARTRALGALRVLTDGDLRGDEVGPRWLVLAVGVGVVARGSYG